MSFGKEVRIRLITMDRTQSWLMDEIRERTGLYMDSSYLSKVLKGEKNPPKVINAIKEILEMEG